MISVHAKPYPYTLKHGKTALVVIDMQRDFIEHGGFGHSLGNDVKRLEAIIPTTAALLGLFRDVGWPVIHTREAHLPDLSNCPPSKIARGEPGLRIGDHGKMGRILIEGEPGQAYRRGQRVRGVVVTDAAIEEVAPTRTRPAAFSDS